MLCSNMLFGQGPWTPWQMFAMGLIGFLGGVCFHNGPLRQSRLSLAIFGAVCSVLTGAALLFGNEWVADTWLHEPLASGCLRITALAGGITLTAIRAKVVAFEQ